MSVVRELVEINISITILFPLPVSGRWRKGSGVSSRGLGTSVRLIDAAVVWHSSGSGHPPNRRTVAVVQLSSER